MILYINLYKFENEMDDFLGKYSISKMNKDRKCKQTFPQKKWTQLPRNDPIKN